MFEKQDLRIYDEIKQLAIQNYAKDIDECLAEFEAKSREGNLTADDIEDM